MFNKEQLIKLLNSANIHFEMEQENPSIIYSNGLVEEYDNSELPSAYLSNLNQNTIPTIKTKVSINQTKLEFSMTSRFDSNFTNFRVRREILLGDAA
ncbi:TPA: hypothetical protein ACGOVP_001996 [Streptococcus suis]